MYHYLDVNLNIIAIIRIAIDITKDISLLNSILLCIHLLLKIGTKILIDEEQQDKLFDLYRGNERIQQVCNKSSWLINIQYALCNTQSFISFENIIKKENNLKDDIDLCRQDIYLGLIQMNLITRLKYLFHHHNLYVNIIHILDQIVIYCNYTSYFIIKEIELLTDIISYIYNLCITLYTTKHQEEEGKEEGKEEGEEDEKKKKNQQVISTLIFLIHLIQIHKKVADILLKHTNIIELIQFIICNSNNAIYHVYSLRLWRIILSYGFINEDYIIIYRQILQFLAKADTSSSLYYSCYNVINTLLYQDQLQWSLIAIHIDQVYSNLILYINMNQQPANYLQLNALFSFIANYYQCILLQKKDINKTIEIKRIINQFLLKINPKDINQMICNYFNQSTKINIYDLYLQIIKCYLALTDLISQMIMWCYNFIIYFKLLYLI